MSVAEGIHATKVLTEKSQQIYATAPAASKAATSFFSVSRDNILGYFTTLK